MQSRGKIIILGVVITLFCLGIGILIGYFIGAAKSSSSSTQPSPSSSSSSVPDYLQDEDKSITDKLFAEVNPLNIRSNLFNMTRKAHVAGTAEDLNGAQRLYNIWKDQYKLDGVTLTRYNVLLCYPNKASPSKVELKDSTGKVIFTSRLQEEENLTPNQPLDPEALPPFHAYAKSGDHEGDLVYANYCRLDDLDMIEKYLKARSTVLEGKIVICRYGIIGRMDKLANVAQRKGKAMILFSDPKDYVLPGGGTFPNDWWLPPTGVQRGTVIMSSGDPLTPNYPSIDSAYRLPVATAPDLPPLSSLPLGYGDAAQLMATMQGDEVPADWRGNMNITYRYGPGHANNVKVRLYVNNTFETRSTYNVIGFIRGRVEPDRYVMMGNHRDAWVYGAVDPTSGTATMVELTRTYSELVRSGWRPRRTLMFCSWGAEEYTLIGSYEWVEENYANLAARAVAYINMDVAVEGSFSLGVSGTPLLYETVYAATKKVSDPHGGTLYDTWLKSYPSQSTPVVPTIYSLGGASDYASFLTKVGVPCVDIAYMYNRNVGFPRSAPLYHTTYDTFYAVDNFIDPGFRYHQSMARLAGELVRSLADSLILPFSIARYSEVITNDFKLMTDYYGKNWTDHQVNTTGVQDAISNFNQAATAFITRVKNVNLTDPFAVRRINDQIMLLERAFIDPRGLPGRPEERHMLFAPSIHDSYAGNSYPGLIDGMWNIDADPDQAGRYETIKKHVSVLAFVINSAASTLAETHTFPR